MKVSIVTVVYNAQETIQKCIDSVAAQTYKNIEYIVIDGKSVDKTNEIISENLPRISKYISEKDAGIYDAINKGIMFASGDVVGVLNSDDFYSSNDVIEKVVEAFRVSGKDSVFADVEFVSAEDESKIVRRYRSSFFKPSRFKYGFMPAHPTFFVKKSFYDKLGLYKIDYRIAADYELLIRFLFKEKISFHYVPEVWVKMKMGGVSTKGIKNTILLNREVVRACRSNGINASLATILLKYPFKLFEYKKLIGL